MLWISPSNYRLFGRRALCTGAAIAALCAGANMAYAGPSGEVITGGSISISRTDATTTVINQTSSRGIIDWRNFDVDTNERVHFNQPNTQSITVNRVRGSSQKTQIDGEIKSNGNIVILNENGVMFGSSSRVDVGGLVASTSDLADDNEFMAGGAVRFKPGSNPNAKVVLNGDIRARDAGLVGLVAPEVENNGVITAKFGRVHMAAGDTATVDFAGDGLIQIDISSNATKQIIRQNGVISADGGHVMLTASTARRVVDSIIQTNGRTSTSSSTGRGGRVEMYAKKIEITSGARVTADGATGGGNIRIGGDYQGGGTMVKAVHTYIAPETYISANAAIKGNGGRVIIWADGLTEFLGKASAKGGAQGGNGGFAEVSGKGVLDYRGFFDLRAPKGKVGNLLLDPTDITISNAANGNVTGASPYSPNADSVVSNLNVTTLQTALAAANVTVQTRATGAHLGNITVVDPITWASTRTLTLDAHNDIIVNAAITGRNITFTAGNDVALNANLVPNSAGAGNLIFQPKTATNTIGIGGGAGILNLSAADMANITGQWASVVIGSTTNTGAMTIAGISGLNSPLTLQNNSSITTTGAISMAAGRAITFETEQLNLGGAVSGTNVLTLRPLNNATTVGLGTGAAGAFHLDNTELGYLTNGFSSIVVGRTTTTGAVEMNTATWQDPLTINAGPSLTVLGAQTMAANALVLNADTIDLQQNLSGTAAITLRPVGTTIDIGLGNGTAGTFNLTDAELARILNGFSSITFGLTTSTGSTQMNTATWNDPLTVNAGNSLTVLGAQTMGANALTLNANAIDIQQNLTGTGGLTIRPRSTTTTVGIGDGAAGAFHLSNAELDRLINGFSVIVLGLSTSTANTELNAYTWNDPLNLYSGSGTLTVSGAQTMGNNLLLLQANGINLNAPLSGTSTLTIQQATAVTMGVGDGAGGTLQLDDAELNRIQDGFSSITLGNNNLNVAMTVQSARTWLDPITFQTQIGNITVNAPQNFGANNASFRLDGNLTFNATMTGTATLSMYTDTATTTIGVAGGAGTLNISTNELDNIVDGWSLIRIGAAGINSTAAFNFNAYTWRDPLRVETDTSVINFNGAQTMGSNDLTVMSRGVININAPLSGSGNLWFTQEATNATMSIGAVGGALELLAADLDNIADGWSEIRFGRNDSTVNVLMNAARTWNDNVRVYNNTGIVNISAAQNFGANNFTLEIGSAPTIGAAVTGTGVFTLFPRSTATTVGLAGGAGLANLSAAALNNITDGWSKLVFGRTDNTSLMTINGYTWLDPVEFLSNTGGMTFAGAQNFGTNNALISTNAALSVNANLNSTGGNLTIQPTSTGTTIGLGSSSGAGALSLDALEIGRMTGWDVITIGRTDGTGLLSTGTAAWNDKVRLITNGNIALTGTMTTTEGAGTNFVLATLGGNLTNTGGAGALNPGAGRYLVYTPTPTADTYGGLTRPTKRYNKTYVGYGPTSVTETGNVYLYAIAPTVAVTINNTSRAYGDANPTFTFTPTALFDGDTAAQAFSTSTMTSAANATSNAGTTHAITGTFLSDMGYTITGVTDGTLTINKRDITATVGNKSRAYGNANPSYSWSDVTWGNLANSETGAVLDSITFTTPTLNATSNAGSTEAISITAFNDNNYNLTTITDGTLSVTKRDITAVIGNKSRAYGDANPSYAWSDVTWGNLANSETGAVLDSITFTTPTLNATSNAGSSEAISITAFNDNNYNLTTITDGTLSVTKRDITAVIGNKSRAYGDANPSYAWSDVVWNNLVNGDTGAVLDSVSFAIPTATATSNAGTNHNVNITGFSDNNYNLTGFTAGTLNITKRDITAVIGNKSRAYGDANPSYAWSDVTWGNLANSETGAVLDSITFTTPTLNATSNAGSTEAISITAFNDNNYNLTTITDGVLSVTKRDITATINNASRAYGDTNPTLTWADVVWSNLANSENGSVLDTVVLTAPSATATSNAGTNHTILISSFNDNNYNLVTQTTGTLNITKRDITATVGNKSRAYGNANPSYSWSDVTWGNLANSETGAVLDSITFTTPTLNATSNAGSTEAISITAFNDNNYNLTTITDGTLSVTKRDITAVIGNKSRAYGDANPSYAWSDVTWGNLANSETGAVLDSITFTTPTLNATSNAGSSEAISITAFNDNNYNLTTITDGTLSVTKRDITAVIGNKSRAYGDANPSYAWSDVTWGNLANSETGAVLDSITFTTPTLNATSNAGSSEAISITAFNDNNYNLTTITDGALSVTKRDITATVGSKSRAYGDANPVWSTLTDIVFANLVNGDTNADLDSVTLTTPSLGATANAGSTQAISVTGFSDNNYNLTTITDGTLSVTKRDITATVGSKSRAYGDANPSYSWSDVTWGNLANSETGAVLDSITFTTPTLNATSNAGSSEAISITAFNDNNYNLTTITDGTLSVTKRDITAVIGNKSRAYGDANPSYAWSDVTWGNLANSETGAVLDSITFTTPTLNATSNAGSTEAISITAFNDNNYNLTTITDGTLSVTKRDITATVGNKSRAYGNANPSYSWSDVTWGNLANSETGAVLDSVSFAIPTATSTSNAGTNHNVNITGFSDNNYNLTGFTAGTLNITKRNITAVVGNKSRRYGNANPTLDWTDVTWSNLVNGDTGAVLDSITFAIPTATATSNAGTTHNINISALSDNNYNLTGFTAGTLTINKAILSIVAQNASRRQGEPNPVFSYIVNGLRNGDSQSANVSGVVLSTSATQTSPIGVYTITAGGGTIGSNYQATYSSAQLTVIQANSIPTTVERSVQDAVVAGASNGSEAAQTNTTTPNGTLLVQEQGTPFAEVMVLDDHDIATMEAGRNTTADAMIIVSRQFLNALNERVSEELSHLQDRENRAHGLYDL